MSGNLPPRISTPEENCSIAACANGATAVSSRAEQASEKIAGTFSRALITDVALCSAKLGN